MKPEHRGQLLVEGAEDLHVMSALFQRHAVPQTFEIRDCKGKSQLLAIFAASIKARSTPNLAILLDADEDSKDAWQGARTQIDRHYPHVCPDSPTSGGTVVRTADGRRFGIWVMPDNQARGALEDFLTLLIPPQDCALPLTGTFVQRCLDECGGLRPTDITKATIYAWLAVQSEPGKRMGQAITARYFNTDSQPLVEEFLTWIRAVLA
jgi:hypothetical protein